MMRSSPIHATILLHAKRSEIRSPRWRRGIHTVNAKSFLQKASDVAQSTPIRLFDCHLGRLVTRHDVRKRLEVEALATFSSYTNTPDETWSDRDLILSSLRKRLAHLGAYAILSHRWTDEELSYAELCRGNIHPKHAKFLKFCNIAKTFYQCRYVWIDTACINKESSSELDESIRSMFSWYRNAHVCIVYLADAQGEDDWLNDPWFDRGWTLQELLAPTRLAFFTKDWSRLSLSSSSPQPGPFDIDRCLDDSLWRRASKYLTRASFSEIIQRISERKEIHHRDLDAYFPSPENAVKCFEYVARRQTTVPEDVAYCLTSLLDIVMPIAYGEGAESAFMRLQIACAERNSDRSIFAWKSNQCSPSGGTSKYNSMLAYGPELFEGCPKVTPDILWRPGPFQSTNVPPSQHPSKVIDPSLTFTNFGLRISAVLFPCKPCEHMYDPYNPYYEVSFLGRNYYIASPLRKDTDRTPQLSLAVLGSFKRPIGDSFFAEEEVLSLVLLQKVGSYWMPTYRRVPVEIPPHLASMYRIFLEDAVPGTIFIV